MTRRYSEEEAQRIFARVAERQRTMQGADGGLSLAELEEAARAAGLDPALVASAAAEVDAAPGPDRRLGGAPVEVVRQRIVAGPIDDDAWAQMVSAMRSEFGQAGMAGQVGRLREWTLISGGTKNGAMTRLAVDPTAEGTRITLSRSIRDAVLGLRITEAIQAALAVLFGAMALFGVESELWIPASIMLALAAAFLVGTQVGTRVWHRHQSGRCEALLDRLELIARASAPPPRHVREADPEAAEDLPLPGRLDLDALDLDDASDPASALRRRTRA